MTELFEKNLHSELIPTKAASEFSGYNTDYLARLCREKKIVGTQIGRTWLINRASLETFIAEQEVRKQDRANELRASRAKEYKKAQEPILRAALLSGAIETKKENTKKVVANVSEEKYIPSPFQYSRPLAAAAVALTVVAGSAYLSTSAHILGTVTRAESAALNLAFAISPKESASTFRITDANTDTTSETSHEYATRQSEIARATLQPSTLAHLSPYTNGSAVMASIASLHALTDSFRTIDEPINTLASERIELFATAAAHPGTTLIDAYLIPGIALLNTGEWTTSKYVDGINAFVDGSPKVAGTMVMALYDIGDATQHVASFVPVHSRTANTQIALASATSVHSFVVGSDAHASFASAIATHVSHAYKNVVEAEGKIAALPIRAQGTILGTIGYSASLLDGSGWYGHHPILKAEGHLAQASDVQNYTTSITEGSSSTSSTASSSDLTASVFTMLPSTWQRYLSSLFNNSSDIVQVFITGSFHTITGLFPGGTVISPTLTVVDQGPLERVEAVTSAPHLTQSIAGTTSDTNTSGTGSNGSHPITQIIQNFYPQTIFGGSLNDAVIAIVRPFVRDSIDAAVSRITTNSGNTGGGNNSGNASGSATITSGSATLTDLNAGTATIGSLTAGSTTLGQTTTGSTTVNGNLNVQGTITAGSLTVSNLSSASGVVAPYIVATNTAATSSFTNLAASSTVVTNSIVTNATSTTFYATLAHVVSGIFDSFTATLATITNLSGTNSSFTNATTTNATSTNAFIANLTAGYATTTSLATTNLGLGGSTFTSLLGTGLINNGGALSLSTSTISGMGSNLNADLLDGLDSTYFLANSFSTSSANAFLATKTTDNLAEGSTSQYFTNARARNAVSSSAVGISYDNATGIFSLASGYGIPTTSSTSAWDAFYQTPSSRIIGGTNLTWSGNTLNGPSDTYIRSLFSASSPLVYNNLTGAFSVSTSTFSGSGSNLNADLLDGLDSTYFLANSYSTTSANYWLSGKSTTNLAEGTNLYYTNARADARVAAGFAGTTTDALAEGTVNRYYTDARARGALSSSIPALSYNSSTGVFSLTSGYTVPLTSSTTDWNTAFINRITSAVAPISITNNAISISQATGSTAGYLSAADFTTFNNKISSTSLSATGPLSYNSSTGVFSLGTVGVANGGTGSTTLSGILLGNATGAVQTLGLGTSLTLNGGILSVSTSTFTGSGSGLNADLLDGLDSTYFLANSYSTTSANYWLTGKSTTNIAEGSNLYYTNARADARVAAGFAGTTTDALAEGSTNKYFTNARAQGAISVSGLPLTYIGGLIGINQASGSQAGYLSSTDYTTFNGKQAALSFTYPIVNTANVVSLAFGTSTSNTWGGTQTFTNAPILGSLTGFLKASAGTLATSLIDLSTDVTSTLPNGHGGTGFSNFNAGDILYADNSGVLAKLPVGSSGQVLKVQAGLPSWGVDQTVGGGGSDGIFATSTGKIYPLDTSGVVLVGTNSTTTSNSIFEVNGQQYISSKLGIATTSPSAQLSVGGNALVSGNVTLGGMLSAASLNLGGSTFTSLLGTGLINNGGTLSLATSSFTGSGSNLNADLLDGLDSTYFLANSYSTTSANYWLSGKSTTNLTEGTNLYYTNARADSRFATDLAGTTTDALAEGATNKYFTNARAQGAISISGLPLTYSGGVIGINQASGSQAGYLSAADYTSFSGKQAALTFSYPLVNTSSVISLAFGTTTANTWSQLQTFTSGLTTNASSTVGGNLNVGGAGYFAGTITGQGTPTLQSTSAADGLVLRGTRYGYPSEYAELRITKQSAAWADNVATAYFQVRNDANNNLVFQAGTAGADSIFNRLQFPSAYTSYTDGAYTSTPTPSDLFELINTTASKSIFKIRGASSQSGKYAEVNSYSGTNGDIFNIQSSGNVGVGTTSPFAKLSVAGDGFFNGNVTATNVTATGTATVAQLIDSGLTTNTLTYANGSKQLSSVTLGNGLTLTGGTLAVSTSTVSGSGSGLNADYLDGLDSTYFLANSYSTSSADYWLSGKSTTNLAEGTNLYYTNARADARVAAGFAGTTTDALAEGTTNKYFTNARAQSAISVSGLPLTYSAGVIGINQASGSQAGYLSAADYTSFSGKQAALAFTYPLVNTANTISLAFGTTTANTWSALQTFTGGINTNSLTLGTLNGALYGNNGVVNSVATTTATLGSEFSYSGTLGSLLGGASGSLTLTSNGTSLTKLAQIAANTILGNPTGATGNVQAVATSSLGIALSDTTGTLSVSRGGTGSTTLTGILKGNGTGAVVTAVAGTDYLTSTTGVTSFNGRTGAVVPGSSDYTTTQVAEGTNLYFTNARAQGAISVSGLPLTYTSGVIGINQANTSQAGYLSAADYTTFNNKVGSSTFASLTTNYHPKWNGTAFVNSLINDDGTNIGFGSSTPGYNFSFEKDQNATTALTLANVTNNTNAKVSLVLNTAFGTIGSLDAFPGGYTSMSIDDSANGVRLIANGAGGLALSSTGTLGTLRFYTNGAERGRFSAAGNLGVGTTSPSQALSVQGNGLFSGNVLGANLTATGTATIGGTIAEQGTGTSTFAGAVSGTNLALSGLSTGLVKVGAGGYLQNAVAGTDYAPATTGTSLLYGNGSGGFSNATIGSGISFIGGALANTGVLSFNGRTGAVVPGSSDYTTTQVAEGTNLYFTNARAQGAISVSGLPLTYTSGVIGINQASGSQAGYLSASDYSSFNTRLSSTSLSAAYPILYNSSNGVISTAFSTTTANTYSALNTFNGGVVANTLTLGTLTGALYGNNGVVNSVATTTATLGSEFSYSGTLGALLGGASGSLTLTSNGTSLTKLAQIAANTILGNPTGATGNVQAVATSSLGIALSDTTGTLQVARGGTGSTTLTGILKGNGTGAIVTAVAGTDYLTSTTGVTSFNGRTGAVVPGSSDYTTTQVAEGTNLYFTNARADARFATDLAGTTTDALAEGTTNKYFTTLRAQAAISVSGLPLTYTSGVIGINQASASQAGYLTASDYNAFNTKLSSTTVSGLTANYHPKWNGTAFVNSLIYDDGTNVGVGSTSPGYTFGVEKDQNAQTSITVANVTNNTAARVSFNLNTAYGNIGSLDAFPGGYSSVGVDDSANGVRLVGNGAGGLALSSSGTLGTLRFYTNGAERGRFSAAGNLGVGTTSPSQALSIQGNALFSGNVTSANLTATGTVTFAGIGSGLVKSTSGVLSTAAVGTDYAPATTGTSLLYGNGAGGFSSATVNGPLTFSAGALGITQATTGASGYLSSTDFNTFNNKISSTSLSAGTGIGYNSTTGVISNTGVTSNVAGSGISVSGATGAVTISNTGVLSFNGRTGAVVPGSSDYTTTQVAEGTNLYFTNARAQGAISVSGLPLTYSAGVIGINQASATQAGYLTASDYNAFNTKLSSTTVSGLTTNYVPKWNGSAFVNSQVFDNGTNVGVGSTSPAYKLSVAGTSYFSATTTLGNGNFVVNTDGTLSTSPLGLTGSFFAGTGAGASATTSVGANFIGYNAGYIASGVYSNFLGYNAGVSSGAVYSNFIGYAAGGAATGVLSSNFIGNQAGLGSTNARNSTFIGNSAGLNTNGASNSIFIGSYAGYADSVNNGGGISASTSIAIGQYAGTGGYTDSIALGHGVINSAIQQLNIGNVLYGTGIYAQDTQSATPLANGKIGIGTSSPTATLSVQGTSYFTATSTLANGNFAINTDGTVVANALGNSGSFFVGANAGTGAPGSIGSTFIGGFAGNGASNASYANFIGSAAGYQASNATYSNFIGSSAGYQASNATYANYLGYNAGYNATNANYATLIGVSAGQGATNAKNALFLGNYAGYNDTVNNTVGTASTSIAIGQYAGTGGYTDSIAIGHGVINSAVGQLNIGNVLYGTGIYARNTQSATPLANGMIGIGTSSPYARLTVGGDVVIGASTAGGTNGDLYINKLATSAGSFLAVDANGKVISTTTPSGSGGGSGTVGSGTTGQFPYYAANGTTLTATSSIFLAASGNVGIGSTSPSKLLSVNGESYFSATSTLANGKFVVNADGTLVTAPYGLGGSFFVGGSAGNGASSANNSNFLGYQTGYNATNANVSNFIGYQAGYGATNAYNANFIGNNAGNAATDAGNANFLGTNAGNGATNASNSNFFGETAGYNASSANNANFFGYQAGYGAMSADNSAFIGKYAGKNATSAYKSNFLGYEAGLGATNANSSNFFGIDAGYNATTSNNSNFFGSYAGYTAAGANNSNFFGQNAGAYATYALQSNFLGYQAGYFASNAANSNFIGTSAGYLALNAKNSIFIGTNAGNFDAVNNTSGAASTSIAIGQNAGTGGYSDSIALGHGVINSAVGQLNIGNVLYGTGIYAQDTQSATPLANGKIGIGTSTPTATLSVQGNGYVSGTTTLANGNFVINADGTVVANALGNIGSFFVGTGAGYAATNAFISNFLGYQAGYQANNAAFSNFLGYQAGYQANNAASSNFLGYGAGGSATDAAYSNFLGYQSGNAASNASYSNFLGFGAGIGATNASNSNFLGKVAGGYATNANNSLFLGSYAGYNDTVNNTGGTASTSIAIGQYAGTGGYSDSIALGHGVINSAIQQVNIGNLIYGNGIYAQDTQSGTPVTNGTVGIGTSSPTLATFSVESGANTTNTMLTGNTNNYLQLNLQNRNNGSTASSDLVITNDKGTASSYYADFGVNSSGNTDSTYTLFGANEAYLYNNDAGLNIGTASSSAASALKFFTGGTLAANERARITSTGNFGIGTSSPSATLSVQGTSYFSATTTLGNGNFVVNTNGTIVSNSLGQYSSLFVGVNAGQAATNAANSNFLGNSAGYGATNAQAANFIGYSAGNGSYWASYSNFLGNSAGAGAINASYAQFIGNDSGLSATNAYASVFIGSNAGKYATNARTSIFIGVSAGYNDTVDNTLGVASTSIAIGQGAGTGGYTDSIALGHGVKNSAIQQLNIGNVLYGTGIYAQDTQSATPLSSGKIGIGTSSPYAMLSVGGSVVVGAQTAGGTNGDLYINNLATNAGSFLAVDGTGKVIATTTPSGSGGGSGTVGSGTTGQFPYYAANGTTLSPTSSLFLASGGNIGIGTVSPGSKLHVQSGSSGVTPDPLAIGTFESSSHSFVDILSGASSYAGFYFGNSTDTHAGEVSFSGSDNKMFFKTHAAVGLTIDGSTSNIGIGSTSPSATLSVQGSEYVSGVTTLANGKLVVDTTGVLFSNPGGNTNSFFVNNGSGGNTGSTNANFIGYNAGTAGSYNYNSNFIGISTGYGSGSHDANFLGSNAGAFSNGSNSNFLGNSAGYNATGNVSNSNFIGYSAGYQASNAASSNFIGLNSGNSATNAASSTFIGISSGYNAVNARNALFLGNNAGLNDTVNNTTGAASTSIAIGDYAGTGGFTDSIAIGHGVTNSAVAQLNIGNVLYGTGIYANNATSSVALATGKIGIGTSTPVSTLSVGGTSYLAGAVTVQNTSAAALAVGPLGSINPTLSVITNTASGVTGLSITNAASGGTTALAVTDSGANSSLTINAKGSGTIGIGTASTGAITLTRATTLSAGATVTTGGLTVSAGTSAFNGGATVSGNFTQTNGAFSSTGIANGTAATVRFGYTGATDSTAMTASTEAPDVYFNLGQTRTHSAGTIALQRDFRINPSTHTFSSASTITTAAALAIDTAPGGFLNATISTSTALLIGGTGANPAGITNGYGLMVYAPVGPTNSYGAAFMSGNIGIGTAAPSAQLHTTGTVRFANFGAGTLTTDASGNLSVSSDERLKDVNGSFTRGLADIENLSPILYHWNATSGLDQVNQYAGFSAQNVQSTIPEAVFTDPRGYLTLQDRPILAASVNAIKELAGRTDTLSLATTSLATQFASLSAQFASSTAAQSSSAMPHALSATSVSADTMTIAQAFTANSVVSQTASVNGTVSANRYVVPQTASTFTFGSSTISVSYPAEVMTDSGNVDMYKLASFGVASAQALAGRTDLLSLKIDDLTTRIAALEALHAATSTDASSSAQGAVGLTVSIITDALKTIGVMVHDGMIALDTLVTHQLVLVKGKDGTSSTGSSVIPTGATTIVVSNPLVHASSKVFLTFTSSIDGAWYLSEKKEGSFTITLAKPQAAEVDFDYFLLQTDATDASQLAGAASTQPLPPANATEASSTPTAPAAQDGGPTVSLNGSAAVQIPQGGVWVDPGATASAADGTDLTSSIVTNGHVDTATPGLYTLTYQVTDAAGKQGQASRVVTVLAPTSSPSGGNAVTSAPPAPSSDTPGGSSASSPAATVSSGNDATPAS